MLTEETRNAILKLMEKYPEKRSALIPALHLAQNEVGYLPPKIQKEVADLFALTIGEVNSVVTFYDMFYEKPVGKHIIHVCKNLSCMLRGSDGLLSSLCKHLQIAPGETSADGEFSIIPSECLAACDRAPMLLIDEEVVGPVQEHEIAQILANAKRKD
ncbi:MAG: NADH-quinone oxidoreductase subunit NuoE [Parachlamydiaceae bacterium]